MSDDLDLRIEVNDEEAVRGLTRISEGITGMMNNLDRITKVLKDVDKGFDDVIKRGVDIVTEPTRAADKAVKTFNDLDNTLELIEKQLDAVKKVSAATGGQFDFLTTRVAKTIAGLKEKEATLRATKEKYEGNTKAAKDLIAQQEKEAKAIEELNKKLKEQEEAQKNINDATKDLTESLSDNLLSLTGVDTALGNQTKEISKKIGVLSQLRKSILDGAKSLGVFKTALISTGVGAIIVLIGSLVAWLTKSQKGLDFVTKTANQFGAVVDVVAKRLAGLIDVLKLQGEAIYKLFTGDIKGASEAMQQSGQAAGKIFNQLGAEIGYAIKQAGELSDLMVEIENRELASILDISEANRKIEEAKEKLADRSLSMAERQQQINILAEEEARLHEINIGILHDKLKYAQSVYNQDQENRDKQREYLEAVAALDKASSDRAKQGRNRQREENRLRNESAKKAKELAQAEKERLDTIKEITSERAKEDQELSDIIRKGQIAQMDGQKKINAEYEYGLELLQRQVDQIGERISGEEKVLQDIIQNTRRGTKAHEEALKELQTIEERKTALTQFHADARYLAEQGYIDATREQRRKEADSYAAIKAEMANIDQKAVEDRLNQLDFNQELLMLEIDAQREAKTNVLTLEQEKEQARLMILKKSLQQRIAILEAAGLVDEAKRVKAQLKVIESEYANFTNGLKKDVLGRLRRSLQDALGLDDEQMGIIEDSISQGIDLYMDHINRMADEAKRKLDEISAQREKVQKELEDEEEKQRQGLASNVSAKEQELAQLAVLEEQAQKEAEQRRKKAVAAQVIAETAQQASSLITAVTNIISAFSSIPIVGVALGIAAAAGMVASFMSLKARAKESTKLHKGAYLAEHIRDSGEVKRFGKTDRNGNEGYRIEGTDLVIGGDEFLMNGQVTAEQLAFLKKMNAGRYKHLDLKKVADTALMSRDFVDGVLERGEQLKV